MNEQSSFSERLHELYEKKGQIAAFGACALIAILLMVWFFHTREQKKTDQYQIAALIAEKLENKSKLFPANEQAGKSKTNEQLFQDLKKLADNDSSVRDHFNGLIAQEYLLKDEGDKAEPYAKRAIHCLRSSGLPLYASFSECSLLIGQNRPREALQVIQKMEEMSTLASPSHHPHLYAFLLMQKAAIQESLGKKEEAEKTLETLKTFVKYSNDVPATSMFQMPESESARFVNHLRDNQTSLFEYFLQPKITY